MKKIVLLAILFCSLVFSLNPGMVLAGSQLRVVDSSVEVDFPASITFNISAQGDVDITDIRLSYTVERMEHAKVVSEIYVSFIPSTSVTTQWVWDMRKGGGLPPGSGLAYWWTVSDADGNKIVTSEARVKIEDERYDWRSITEGMVTLYWYRGDDSFGEELMEATQEALSRLADNSGAELESSVSLYIYASSADLQGSMIFPQEWTGGVAFTRYGIIAIGIGTTSSDVAWGKRAIAHELTHLVIHQVTFNPYNDLPTWLDEGLAMMAEGELEPYFEGIFTQASDAGEIISLRSLASPFSAFSNQSYLSYAESYKVVKYLIDTYGREKMLELLNTFRQGSGYDEALERVYGFDTDGLDARWTASLQEDGASPTEPVPSEPVVEEKGGVPVPPIVIGILAGLLTGLLLLVCLLVENLAWKRGW